MQMAFHTYRNVRIYYPLFQYPIREEVYKQNTILNRIQLWMRNTWNNFSFLNIRSFNYNLNNTLIENTKFKSFTWNICTNLTPTYTIEKSRLCIFKRLGGITHWSIRYRRYLINITWPVFNHFYPSKLIK